MPFTVILRGEGENLSNLNILISMLQINEKDRPDFIELEKMMEKIYNK